MQQAQSGQALVCISCVISNQKGAWLNGLSAFVHAFGVQASGICTASHTCICWGCCCILAGVPPQLAALTLAFNVNLFGSLTHYASGQAAVYYGSGFVELKEVFKVGAACAVMDLTIWGVLGMAWWKFLGWY